MFLSLTKTIWMYSLAIIMKYFLQEIKLFEVWWFSNNIYLTNNVFFCYYNVLCGIWYRVNYLKYINNNLCSVFAFICCFIWNHIRFALLFVVLQTFNYRPIYFNYVSSLFIDWYAWSHLFRNDLCKQFLLLAALCEISGDMYVVVKDNFVD